MKNCLAKSTVLLTGGLAVFVSISNAALVQTVTTGFSQIALDGVIAVKFVLTGQSTLASVADDHNPSSGWTMAALNDGSAAANANLVFYYSPDGTVPVTFTVDLNHELNVF